VGGGLGVARLGAEEDEDFLACLFGGRHRYGLRWFALLPMNKKVSYRILAKRR